MNKNDANGCLIFIIVIVLFSLIGTCNQKSEIRELQKEKIELEIKKLKKNKNETK